MRLLLTVVACAFLMCVPVFGAESAAPVPDKDGFYSLFDGKTLEGWKVGRNADTFKVVDGNIVAHGPVAHLFYVGPVNNHNFRNFHFKAEVFTFPKANSGIYFHTEYQEAGWPAKGFEAQVNQTHADRRKTGGLYAVKDVMDVSPAKDEEWFLYEIIVQGKHVVLKVNGKVTCDWTEPDPPNPPSPGRKISSGTFALQGHDPGSKVLFRNIMVKPLPD